MLSRRPTLAILIERTGKCLAGFTSLDPKLKLVVHSDRLPITKRPVGLIVNSSTSTVPSSPAANSANRIIIQNGPLAGQLLSASPVNAKQQQQQQQQPPPLKIQISSPPPTPIIIMPSSGTPTASVMANQSSHHYHQPQQPGPMDSPLLLATVNQTTVPSSSSAQPPPVSVTPTAASSIQSTPTLDPSNDSSIFKLIDEFLVALGPPIPDLTGSCVICSELSPPGETYHIYSSPPAASHLFLSPEHLGVWPYFPMLQQQHGKPFGPHLACIFCYHSLIAQWTVYHLSGFAEDKDVNQRTYNCKDFFCYVCGVITYRELVRYITVKNFPFLKEHKRPAGRSFFSNDSKESFANFPGFPFLQEH